MKTPTHTFPDLLCNLHLLRLLHSSPELSVHLSNSQIKYKFVEGSDWFYLFILASVLSITLAQLVITNIC